jgi:hypothetical protein
LINVRADKDPTENNVKARSDPSFRGCSERTGALVAFHFLKRHSRQKLLKDYLVYLFIGTLSGRMISGHERNRRFRHPTQV